MNKRQSRLFATNSTASAAVMFLGMTLDSHRQFGKLTNPHRIAPGVTRGDGVWCANNRINCHGVIGEGSHHATPACG